MKKWKVLALVLALCMALGCLLAGCGKDELGIDQAQKDPLSYLNDAIERTEAAAPSYEWATIEKLVTALEKQATVTVDAQVEGVDLNVTFAYDAQMGTYATVVGEEDGMQITAKLWCDGQNLCVQAPELLGETVYGIALDTLEEDLATSEIWSLLGIRYDDVKEQLDQLLDQLDALSGTETDNYLDKLQQAAEKIMLIFNDIQYSASEGDGNSVVVSCAMTKEQMDKLLDLVADEMLAQALDALEYNLNAEALKEALDQVAGDVQLDVTISNDTGLITAVAVDYCCQMEGEDVRLLANVDLADLTNITATVTCQIDGEAEDEELVINLRNNSSDGKLDWALTVTADEEKVLALSACYDGTNLSAALTANGESMALTCKCVLTESKVELSDITVNTDGVDTDLPLTITVSAEATVEAVPTYTNILTMSEMEMMQLLMIFSGFGMI